MTTSAASSTSTNSTLKTLADARDRVTEFVSDNAGAVRDRVSDIYDSACDRSDAAIRASRRIVRQHPFESVFVVLGVGLLAGIVSGLLMGGHKRSGRGSSWRK